MIDCLPTTTTTIFGDVNTNLPTYKSKSIQLTTTPLSMVKYRIKQGYFKNIENHLYHLKQEICLRKMIWKELSYFHCYQSNVNIINMVTRCGKYPVTVIEFDLWAFHMKFRNFVTMILLHSQNKDHVITKKFIHDRAHSHAVSYALQQEVNTATPRKLSLNGNLMMIPPFRSKKRKKSDNEAPPSWLFTCARSIKPRSRAEIDRLIHVYGNSCVLDGDGGDTTVTITDTTITDYNEKSNNTMHHSSEIDMTIVNINNNDENSVEVKSVKHLVDEPYDFYGYKIAGNKKGDSIYLVKLGIYKNNKSLVAMGRGEGSKMRTNLARVLKIGQLNRIGNDIQLVCDTKSAHSSIYTKSFTYVLGEDAEVLDFDDNMKSVCVPGIHFLTTPELAITQFAFSNYGVILNKEWFMSMEDDNEMGGIGNNNALQPIPNDPTFRPVDSKDDIHIKTKTKTKFGVDVDILDISSKYGDAIYTEKVKNIIKKERNHVYYRRKFTSKLTRAMQALDLAF